jgi:hypothetical protein
MAKGRGGGAGRWRRLGQWLGGAGLVLAAAVAVLPPVAAQGTGLWVARISGVASGPLPAGSVIVVSGETADDTDLRLATDIATALTAKGYRVGDTVAADGSTLQLWFDTEMSAATVGNNPGAATDTEVGDPVVDDEMFGGDGGGDDRDVVSPVPEATFRFGPGGRVWQGQPYALTFIVGRSGEPPLWQGAVRTRITATDPYDVARAMVPLLVDQIGKTGQAERSFP